MRRVRMAKHIAVKTVVTSLCCALLLVSAGRAEQTAPSQQVVPLTAKSLYQGWRASRMLGKSVLSTNANDIGIVRNIVIGPKGKIKAIILESGVPEFVYRIPWDKIDVSQFPNKIIADIPPGGERQLPLVASVEASNDFRVTDVIGDYARLQAGLAFGYVSDVIFSPDARMLAVLVLREASGGGGAYAFGFPAGIGQWNPSAGYYGLPYVTTDQANNAAIRVDSSQF